MWWLILIQKSSQYSVDAAGIENQREAYFNGSVYLRLLTPMTLWTHSAISFRSCRGEYRLNPGDFNGKFDLIRMKQIEKYFKEISRKD